MANGDDKAKFIVGATIAFVILDYVIHYIGLLPEPSQLPPYYFIGKLALIPAWLLVDKVFPNLKKQALAFYLVLASLLQIRYIFYYSNLYSLLDHTLFIGVHAILIFFAVKITEFFQKNL